MDAHHLDNDEDTPTVGDGPVGNPVTSAPPGITPSANEEEARRALALGRDYAAAHDYGRADRLLRRSLTLFPLPAAAAELRAVAAAAAVRGRGAAPGVCVSCGRASCTCGARSSAGAAPPAVAAHEPAAAAAPTAAAARVATAARSAPAGVAPSASPVPTARPLAAGAVRWPSACSSLSNAACSCGRTARRAWVAYRAAYVALVGRDTATPLALLWLAIVALAVVRVLVGKPLLRWLLAGTRDGYVNGGGGRDGGSPTPSHLTPFVAMPSSFALSVGLSLLANVVVAFARSGLWRAGRGAGRPAGAPGGGHAPPPAGRRPPRGA